MASRNHKALQKLSKTFYGTENYITLQTKQLALIKAIIKDTNNKQNVRVAARK
jgi:redox-regulated HSP33 family molecular chaperone